MSVIQTTKGHWLPVQTSPFLAALTVWLVAAGGISIAADGQAEVRGSTPEGIVPRSSMKKPAGVPSAPTKVIRYAERLLEKYDLNRDGVLQKDEWVALHGHPEFIDTNRDGNISLDELSNWVADYGRRKRLGVPFEPEPAPEQVVTTTTATLPKSDASSATVDEPTSSTASAATTPLANGERRRDSKFFVPSNRLPAGLPEWFITKDVDGDGQLTVSEYSPTSNSQELADFAKLDANGDGVMTAKECVGKPAAKPAKKVADSATEGSSNDGSQTPAKSSRSRRKASSTP